MDDFLIPQNIQPEEKKVTASDVLPMNAHC